MLLHPALRAPLPGGGTASAWEDVPGVTTCAGFPILLAHPESWFAQLEEGEDTWPLEDLPFRGLAALARYLPGLGDADMPLRRAVARALEHAPAGAALAVELGCSIGADLRALRARADHVIGVDTFLPVLRAARAQLAGEEVPWPVRIEGRRFRMDEPRAFPRCDGVTLVVGDGQDPPVRPGTADIVLAMNVLDNVPQPRTLLAHIDALAKPGALVVIGSPFAWHDGITPFDNQLAGAPIEDAPDEGTSGMLADLLGPEYSIVMRDDVPWMLRDHARTEFHYLVHVIAARKRGAALL